MPPKYPFKNLVFEGGGVKGVAYVGALQALEERGVLEQVTRVGGASVGGINALLLSLRYTPEQVRRIIWKLDFKTFLDDSWGVLRDTRRFLRSFGWYRGDFFRAWAADLIGGRAGNPDATFNDLRQAGFRDLYLVGTNVSTGFSEVFSPEHTPRMRVADALRISMSIPFFFTAVRLMRRDLYVDGGLLRNFPVRLFDREKYLDPDCRGRHSFSPDYYAQDNRSRPRSSSPYLFNKETLGFRLDARDKISVFRDGAEPQRREIADLFDFVGAVVSTALDVQQAVHLESDDWQRTIYIDSLGVSTFDFGLKAAAKRDLIAQGRAGVEHYFDWYDNARGRNLPCNHPGYTRRGADEA